MTKEIIPFPNRISILAPKSGSKEITSNQGVLDLEIERDVGGIGMGVLSDGTPYLNQRGLAVLCGVQNAHIGTISSQWTEVDQKPRIVAIKSILAKVTSPSVSAHMEISHRGKIHYCYPADVCLAILGEHGRVRRLPKNQARAWRTRAVAGRVLAGKSVRRRAAANAESAGVECPAKGRHCTPSLK